MSPNSSFIEDLEQSSNYMRNEVNIFEKKKILYFENDID